MMNEIVEHETDSLIIKKTKSNRQAFYRTQIIEKYLFGQQKSN